MKCFEEFRLMHGIDDQFPIASSNISLFIAFLSIRGYAASTVATYISAIGYYHKVNGFIDPNDNFVIREMIEGFRRKGPKCKDIRQPITLPMLRLILASLDSVCSSQFESLAFKAAFSVAFFGFMCVWEKLLPIHVIWYRIPSLDFMTLVWQRIEVCRWLLDMPRTINVDLLRWFGFRVVLIQQFAQFERCKSTCESDRHADPFLCATSMDHQLPGGNSATYLGGLFNFVVGQ